MHRHLLNAAVAACALLLAVPALAGARPVKRDFNHTFPHAARLCAKVAGGKAPKRLAASADKVAAACDTLHKSFADAQAAFAEAVPSLRQQAMDALAVLRATCREARANHDRAACKAAREATRPQIKDLRSQARAAAKSYRMAIRSARKAFWSSIRELRGGGSVKPDAPTDSTPTVAMPGDSEVADA